VILVGEIILIGEARGKPWPSAVYGAITSWTPNKDIMDNVKNTAKMRIVVLILST